MKNGILRLILWANIIWALIILLLCAMPSEDIPDPHLDIPHLDKVVHFGMFFIMSLLLSCVLEHKSRLRLPAIYAIAVLAAFIYGGAIEILQYYYFNRGGDVWDLSADVIGSIAGCLCYPLAKRLLSKLVKSEK